jgi:hypothetical protein
LKSLKGLLILLTIFLAFGASAFLSWGYSSLLDFFPWGDNKSYVIWEPLVLYFIVPPLILVGCFLILLSKQRRNQLLGLHLLIIGLSFTLPSVFGFDLETDLKGRWCGVLVAVFATILTTSDILKEIKREWIVQPDESSGK